MIDRILFYGTLRSGAILAGTADEVAALGDFRLILRSEGLVTLQDMALYDLGHSPGVLRDKPGAITLAECFAFEENADLLQRFDIYEYEYDRVRMPVGPHEAWVYVWRDTAFAEARLIIRHGDWLRHVAER